MFNESVNKQLSICKNMLVSKSEEYTPKAQTDRLVYFKKAAVLTNSTPKAALFGMLAKHIVSISDMCTSNQKYTIARWEEKITDNINYLLILKALIEEEQHNG